jgi:6-pyruvoyltetrahydropterin/6-carboxytetrahydropterin synthase
MIRITSKYRFSASHRLHAPALSDAQNRELYGKCDHPYGHGHNYELEVSVRGPVEERSGQAVDRAALGRLVEEQVLHPFDHRNLSVESAAFQNTVPTTENLAHEIYRRLEANWKSAFPGPWPVLDRIRIAETARNIFEISANGQT